jgi:hypothetical protein
VAQNVTTLLDAIADGLEAITPDVRAGVLFKRWTGEGLIERAPIEVSERRFQLRLGLGKTPRTLSSTTSQWQRAELLLVVRYNFTEPRQNDSGTSNLGVHTLPWADHKQIVNKLVYGNVFSAVSGVKRLLLLSADTPGDTSRTWRFDFEWAESF